jgi:glutaminyl-tRNA synthetase
MSLCLRSDEPAKQLTIQRIYHKNSDGTMGFYNRFAGTMTYHPTHGHMHTDDWGTFTLRVQDPNDPNPLNWPIVSDGAKMGFCLMDYYDCGASGAYGHCRDENRYSEDYLAAYPEVAEQGFDGGTILTANSDFPNNGLGGQGYNCSVIEQGISVGWTDLYGAWLTDQWINLDPSLCNGEYWIVGEIDKNNYYLESNKDNNWTAVPFTLTQQLEPDGFSVSITTSEEPILCAGESITLSSSITNETMEYTWSNGMSGSSISVTEAGSYYVQVSGTCGSSTSESITVVSAEVDTPIANNVTINAGESASLFVFDWAHGQSDYCEQISHSLCSLEFEPHRKLYDWFVESLKDQKEKTLPLFPKQREFARLNLTYTIMSKRKLAELVKNKNVSGWDDPRMPTISGLRRRGYTPESIKAIIKKIGVAKRENLIDVSLLEFCVRDDLNKSTNRKMVVINPLKLTITNYPEQKVEQIKSENNPELESAGFREIPFSRHLYIEKEDFLEEAGKKFFRLTIGKEARLKSAYIIKAEKAIKNSKGEVTEVLCVYDQKSKSGSGTEESQRRVKGTLHWVSQEHGVPVEIRDYDRLFLTSVPGEESGDLLKDINPESFKKRNGFAEPSLANVKPGSNFQFQRKGYYVVDSDSSLGKIIFNKTVGLRDTWKAR